MLCTCTWTPRIGVRECIVRGWSTGSSTPLSLCPHLFVVYKMIAVCKDRRGESVVQINACASRSFSHSHPSRAFHKFDSQLMIQGLGIRHVIKKSVLSEAVPCAEVQDKDCMYAQTCLGIPGRCTQKYWQKQHYVLCARSTRLFLPILHASNDSAAGKDCPHFQRPRTWSGSTQRHKPGPSM